MRGNVYAKTDKGREEIATRKNRLPAKLRALLLMVDGQRSLEALADSVGLAGLADDNAATLLEEGYIVLIAKAAPPDPAAKRVPASSPGKVSAPRPTAPSQANLHDIYSSRFRRTE